ncbi:uncharacterized protein LOC141754546 [Sebastes fasciatus]|uniref:uncharacterized protein LOC141754546 n=1 Tax=Sebastes fasciatus TaxID=394691 RepID=UPI003D9F7B43
MSQLEELQVFVRERLHAATSDILGAVVKAVTDYEEQAVRLKEENHRNRSLLDIILKAQATLTEAGHAKKHTLAASGPDASDSIPARKARETPRCSSDLQRVFTSRTDFLKFAGNGNCPYCLRRNQATEKHLMKKHYLPAVHFTEHGTQKFIVPCLCKYLIKGRSHWHCSFCSSILTRKGNFELHLTKQHACTILLQSQDAEIYQPAVSAIEEEFPLSPEPGYQQEFSSLDREAQQAAPLLQVKEEEERETCRRVSHPGWQNSEQLQIEGEQIQKGNSQTSLEADNADIVVMDSYIRDLGEINSVENGKTHPHSNSSNQHLETQLNSGVGGIRHPAGESQHTTPCSSLKALNSKRKAGGKRKKSSPPSSLNTKKSTQLSISQNPAGPHRCKACGKTFHYMYTLRTHAQTHAMDKLHVCGICGKRSESRQSLVQHLQSHTKRNKCDICGKQFSNNSRLEQHRRFHRPKGLNVMSSA